MGVQGGNNENNRTDNLAYGTVADNSADEVRLGRTHYSRMLGRGRYVLQPDQVLAIRSRRSSGETNVALASDYGVSKENISHIVNGRSWRSLEN